ncbi:uncharacterized protein THITE_2116532 [Thermothielavioides terrestris NRRL 8126]|uniref:Uncharacterized protein n=2 Tax=Thermothielavioides terrestris TaxID=2587410 RepID=G2R6M3_THETT|nr:uncharacterized protein THITE_2116532 [Thermothielavioides terrestris NRRL 8126]AEO67655.1 hypothetical protein THITE_2116532 [Thermothielavioides terrestris NRRL 8126]
MGSVEDRTRDQSPSVLKDFFMERGDLTPNMPPANVFYTFYYPGQSSGVADPGGPRGKALVTVDDGGKTADQRQILVLRLYLANDDPRLELRFTVDDGMPLSEGGVTVPESDKTTDGNKVYPPKE